MMQIKRIGIFRGTEDGEYSRGWVVLATVILGMLGRIVWQFAENEGAVTATGLFGGLALVTIIIVVI